MKNFIIAFVALGTFFFSCNQSEHTDSNEWSSGEYDESFKNEEVMKEMNQVLLAGSYQTTSSIDSKDMMSNGNAKVVNSSTPNVSSSDNGDVTVIERKLLKTGNISFETPNLQEGDAKVRELVKQFDGYISYETLDNYYSSLEQTITVRLPSDKFDQFIESLYGEMGSFDSKQINVQDVTEEYVDVQSRLKTKYEMETSYLALLKKAKNVGDMLEVERELGYIRAEIESMEGRLRYLDDRSDFSTITLTFYEYKDAKVLNFFGEVGQNFQSGWRGLKNFTLGLISAWPFLIILSVVIWFIRKWWKNRKAK